jgi:hypothetical protein
VGWEMIFGIVLWSISAIYCGKLFIDGFKEIFSKKKS